MKGIKTVIWDCDGVMWNHRKERTIIIAKALNIWDDEQFEKQYLKMFKEFLRYFSNKKVTLEEYYKMVEITMPILREYSITAKEFEEVLYELSTQTRELNKELLEVLEYLKSKKIKNIIKTDWFRKTQIKVLEKYDILQYIKELYFCDNTYLKSSPLAKRGIIKPGQEKQYVIIGDSLENDICFANDAQIRSIWFNPNKVQNKTQYNPTYEIQSLLEIRSLI